MDRMLQSVVVRKIDPLLKNRKDYIQFIKQESINAFLRDNPDITSFKVDIEYKCYTEKEIQIILSEVVMMDGKFYYDGGVFESYTAVRKYIVDKSNSIKIFFTYEEDTVKC